MFKLRQIVYTSLISTGRFPRWWILALAQVIAFSVMGEMGRPHWLDSIFVSWLIISAASLGPVTVWLWLEIEASGLKTPKIMTIKSFTQNCMAAAAIIFSSVFLVLIARFLYRDWVFLAFVSSLVAATAVLAMLYAVLCGQPFSKSIALAADTWNKKISLAAAAAFILILAHGVSYAVVHGLLGNIGLIAGFSVFSRSATMWVLLFALIFCAAFIGAFLNCFLVLLFLETIKREKDAEEAKQTNANLKSAVETGN